MPSKMPAGLDLDQFESIRLGSHIYEVVPQPLPLLKRDLADLFDGIAAGGDITADNIGEYVTGSMRDILGVFLPDIMPLHEWEGYPTKAAMEGNLLDRDWAREHAPTGPQVRLAITVCFKSNGLDAWKLLGKLVDPTLLKSWITRQVAGFLSQPSVSESSPPAPTASTTSSSAESPTEDAIGDTMDEVASSLSRLQDVSASTASPSGA